MPDAMQHRTRRQCLTDLNTRHSYEIKEAMMEKDAGSNPNSLSEETEPMGHSVSNLNRQNSLAGGGPPKSDVWLAREWAVLGGD